MKKTATAIALFLLSISCFAQNIDIDILKSINGQRNRNLDPTFRLITNTAIPISVAAPVIVYSIGLLNSDRPLKQKGIFIGETLAVSAFSAVVLKEIIKRDRPFVTYPFIDRQTEGNGYSMPSGHTSLAFATATSLSVSFPKWYVIAPSFLWAGAVGYSRMDLGVHYPSDVLVGAIIGSGSAYVCYKVNNWLTKKAGKKRKATINGL